MKELNDDDIQNLLEKGLGDTDKIPTTNQDDLKAYQILFDGLKQEPAEGLPFNFAAKVSASIKAKLTRKADIKLYTWAAIMGIAGFGIAYAVLVVYSKNAASQFYTAISAYKWAFVLALTCFLAIQYLDQKLVKEHK